MSTPILLFSEVSWVHFLAFIFTTTYWWTKTIYHWNG